MKKLVLLFSLAASAAYADLIQFTGLPVNTEYGTYNGYAFATIDGVANQQLICDDHDSTTFVPSGLLTYNESGLTGSNPLQYARFLDPLEWVASVGRYEEAAWLLEGLSQAGAGSVLDLTGDFQYALWHLFEPGVGLPNSTAQTLLNDAEQQVQLGGSAAVDLYSRLRIFTPAAGFTSNQEFLQLGPAFTPLFNGSPAGDPPAVPEPPSSLLILIGTGMIGLTYGSRRWLRQVSRATTGSNLRASAQ